MASFDLELWKSRARDRYTAAVALEGSSALRASLQFVDDVRFSTGLAVLMGWCGARGLTVTFSRSSGGTYFAVDKNIVISSRAAPMKQLFICLHEAGHHLIGDRDRDDRYGMGYSAEGTAKRTLHHRVDVVDEEFEAWHRGWKLGRKLDIVTPSDKPAFDAVRVKMLQSYMKWAVGTGGGRPSLV